MLDWAAQPKKQEATEDATVQGSTAWLGWRNKGIGSSDAPSLLGHSPWKTTEQLYQEKMGLYKPVFGSHQRSAMERGKELEPKIRDWYEAQPGQAGHKFPDATQEYEGNDKFRVSYDGINRIIPNPNLGPGRIIEIKAPNAKDHACARGNSVPEKYQPQVQWQLLISGVPRADYVSFGADGTYAIVEVYENTEMQKELLRRATMMVDCMNGKREFKIEDFPKWIDPKSTSLNLNLDKIPTLSAIGSFTDVGHTPEAQDIEGLVAEALLAQAEFKAAEAKFEGFKVRLKQILGDKTEMQAGEAEFGYISKKGSVKYDKIEILKTMDLEQFRGSPTKNFYFNRISSISK